MGDKLAHQKVLNKEWNNCTLGYMFRSHGWTLQVLATSHLEAWWWMALMYIRYRYSTTQLKWLSKNRLTRFKAKKYGFKNGSNKWNSFFYKSIIYFVSHFHTYIKLYNKWITTRYFKKMWLISLETIKYIHILSITKSCTVISNKSNISNMSLT